MESRKYIFNKSNVSIVSDTIINSKAQVIVSSDDTLITMSGGVSMAIVDNGGDIIQKDAQRHLPSKVGDVVVSTAGGLCQEYVFHCLTIDDQYLEETWRGLNLPTKDKIEYIVRSCMEKCFRLLAALDLSSIAFPVIGSGSAHMPFDSVMEIMVDEIGACLLKTNAKLDVEIYVYQPTEAQERYIGETLASKAAVINYIIKQQEAHNGTIKTQLSLTDDQLKEYSTKDKDVFISYSRKDTEKAFELRDLLESWGIKAWIDKNGIYSSSNFMVMIEDAIEDTKAVIFLSSEHSNQSEYVKKEVAYAISIKKPVIPIMLDDSPFGKGLRADLSRVDQVDFSNYEEGQRKLRMSIDYILGTYSGNENN